MDAEKLELYSQAYMTALGGSLEVEGLEDAARSRGSRASSSDDRVWNYTHCDDLIGLQRAENHVRMEQFVEQSLP